MKKNNIFWVSFSDLMTSLFFVMLVLFVLAIGFLQVKINENEALIIELKRKQEATEKEKKKLAEINDALKNLDPQNFMYSEQFKKHILITELIDNNGNQGFPRGESNIMNLSVDTRTQLRIAGYNLMDKMLTYYKKYPEIQYLIIIEGQASKDDSPLNDKLSYERALALRDFWFANREPNLSAHQYIKKYLPNCEFIIAGSGQYGIPRDAPDIPPKNQRFLVTIIPKYGAIEKDGK